MAPTPKVLAAIAAATGISVAVLSGSADLIRPHEGLRLRAYPDPGNGAIATICYGETQGVNFGDVRTAEECEAMLLERLPDYLGPIYKLLPDLPDHRAIAYGSTAWNMGVGILTRRSSKCLRFAANDPNKCVQSAEIPGTSIVDLERAGQPAQACARLKRFVYAGGKKLPGLEKRRAAEYRVCMGESK